MLTSALRNMIFNKSRTFALEKTNFELSKVKYMIYNALFNVIFLSLDI